MILKSFSVIIAVSMLVGFSYAQPYTQDCDVDDYIIKAIGVEEPWLENSFYTYVQADNNKNGQLSVYPELETKFSKKIGAEIDLPYYVSSYPLGKGGSATGPLTIGPKFLLLRRCDFAEGKAYLFTFETELSYWANPHTNIISTGSSASEQIEYGMLNYPYFSTGEIGYTEAISQQAVSGYFVNLSVGKNITSSFAVQTEAEIDNQYLHNNTHALEGFVMPQIEYHIYGWMLGLGEQVSVQEFEPRPQYSTWIMVEREFE